MPQPAPKTPLASPLKTPAAPRQRDADRSQAAILKASRDEFAEHGLGGARMERIAERAALDKRLIYYYFEMCIRDRLRAARHGTGDPGCFAPVRAQAQWLCGAVASQRGRVRGRSGRGRCLTVRLTRSPEPGPPLPSRWPALHSRQPDAGKAPAAARPGLKHGLQNKESFHVQVRCV